MSASILGALKYLPASVARKVLSKTNPGFETYFAKALSYGIDANRALDYLTEKFESGNQRSHREQLERGAANNTLRPDEAVSRSEMSNAAIPGKILKGAASLALGGSLGMEKKQQLPEQQEVANISPEEKQRLDALTKYNQHVKAKKEKSPLSPENLSTQFQEQYGQNDTGDDQIIAALQQLLKM